MFLILLQLITNKTNKSINKLKIDLTNIIKKNFMSSNESSQTDDIKSELRNFIQLLQSSDPTRYKSIKSPGRLSVILSASQPESSSADKQNSSQSANCSIKYPQFETGEAQLIKITIKQLKTTRLTAIQDQLLAKLTFCINDLIKRIEIRQAQNLLLEQQLNKQKKGTDQLLEALVKLDEEQKDLWSTYYQLSDKFKQKCIDFDLLFKENQTNKEQNDNHKKQIKFIKNLVYVANQNYEQLEEKYNKLCSKSHMQSKYIQKPNLTLRQKIFDQSKSSKKIMYSPFQESKKIIYSPLKDHRKKREVSFDNYQISSSCSPLRKSSKSIKSRKSVSPILKDKEDIESNFIEAYRKMLMKNLKFKQKKNQI